MSTETIPNEKRCFVFRGDHLALDFINTEIRNAAGGISDLLTDADALADWLTQTGLLIHDRSAEITPSLLDAARSFRSELRQIAEAHVAGKDIPTEAVGEVNRVLQSGIGYGRLEIEAGKLKKRLARLESSPLDFLLPIAEAATDLLTGEQAEFVRKCGSASCILFFLDTSKNHKRRWCSMSACGNRRKVAAHYQRTHRGAEDAE